MGAHGQLDADECLAFRRSEDAATVQTPSVLSVSNLTIRFDDDSARAGAVFGLTFDLAARATLAIIGESGSGKSLSCRALLGLLPRLAKATGSVRYGGKEILSLSGEEMRKYRGREIAMVFQDAERALNPTMPIGRQITEVIRAHALLGRKAAEQHAVDLLHMLRLPTPRQLFSSYPHELSGGMRQRVMIAIAIAASPKILIADEPTASLDVLTGARVMQLLRDLQRELEMSLIVVSHDLRLVADLSDAVLVMRAGRTIEHSSTAGFMKGPQTEYGRALLAAAPQLDSQRQSALRHRPPALLEVRELVQDLRASRLVSMTARSVRAVDGVTFDLAPGEILGVVGETGAGKSTLVRSVLQALRPGSGSVLLRGHDLTKLRGRRLREQRRSVQLVFQDSFASLNPKWTVFDIVEEPLIAHRYGDAGKRADRVRTVLQLVDLPTSAYGYRRPEQLSGGQCQRIAIARAIALEPQIIICDEAVSSLDTLIQRQIVELLRTLREKLELAILFISHDLALVHEISDRIAVMLAGRLCELGPTDAVCREPHHPYSADLIAWAGSMHRPSTSTSDNRSAAPLAAIGCRYHPRCSRARDKCRTEEPRWRSIGSEHMVACHYPLHPLALDVL